MDKKIIYMTTFSSIIFKEKYKKVENRHSLFLNISLSLPKKINIPSLNLFIPPDNLYFKYQGELANLYLENIFYLNKKEFIEIEKEIIKHYFYDYKVNVLNNLIISSLCSKIEGKILVCQSLNPRDNPLLLYSLLIKKWLENNNFSCQIV